MRILIVAPTAAYLPNFRSVLESLAERGHELHVAFEFEQERLPGQFALVDDLAETYPNVSRGTVPGGFDRWSPVTRDLRRGLDSLKYVDPRYHRSPQLRARARRRAPAHVQRLVDAPILRRPRARRLVHRAAAALEQELPVPVWIRDFFDRERPDLLVVIPLVGLGGSQADFPREARRRGIPAAGWIYSWDNLTSKGSIHEVPDRVMVWNDVQRREAVDLHGVPEERVVVTGAQAWDHWFDWRPSTSHAEFCERVGLRPDRPFVLYLGSSGGGLGLEAPFVERWVAAMRESDLPHVGRASVLVRPHPHAAYEQWQGLAGDGDGSLSVFPRSPEQPNNAPRRADFYDSLHHSAAVAGVNTSVFIEAAIVGRPVLAVPAPEFRIAQTGTPHFSYFLSEGGGLLSLAGSMEEHLQELESALAGEEHWAETRRRFLEGFVRPYGLDEPATPRFVAAVETLGELIASPPPAGPARASARGVLELIAAPRLVRKYGRRSTRSLRRVRRKAVRRTRRVRHRTVRRLRRVGRRWRFHGGRFLALGRRTDARAQSAGARSHSTS
jgi:hypothetical protein